MRHEPSHDRFSDVRPQWLATHPELSSGNDVDARQVSPHNLLFSQNNRFNQEKTGQFSGLLAGMFFRYVDYEVAACKRPVKHPLWACNAFTPENAGFLNNQFHFRNF
jgi:hypothetical protein